MKLKRDDATIFFKVFFDSDFLNLTSFSEFCKKLQNFPQNTEKLVIKGLRLTGDYYFRKIQFSDAKNVSELEINKITRITPITNQTVFPFLIKHNCIEVRISGKGDFSQLKNKIDLVDNWLDNLFKKKEGKKIEIHLKGAWGKLGKQIIEIAIPRLLDGTYHYQTIEKKQPRKGELSLPVSHYENLPDDIKDLIDVVCNSYSLKLSKKDKKFILKASKKIQLGLSLYSDETYWFQNTLQVFEEQNLFEPSLSTASYQSLSHLK
ncbi:MAG: hypothetical protein ACI86H_002599 [bacterium]|jgi:hypothetical protein